MSTDIIQFQLNGTGQSQKAFQLDALQLYLAITVPLTFLVFIAWYGVYWYVDRKGDQRRSKHEGGKCEV